MAFSLRMVNLDRWVAWDMALDLRWADITMGLEDLQCRFLAHGLVEH